VGGETVRGYRIYERDGRMRGAGGGAQNRPNWNVFVPAGTTSFTLQGMATARRYNFIIKAVGVRNNSDGAAAGVNLGLQDNDIPPSVPSGLQASRVTPGTVTVSWTASTGLSGGIGYNIYRDGELIGTTDRTDFVDRELTQNTSYTYEVEAFDADSNVQAVRAVLPVTTITTGTPAALRATGIASESIAIAWDAPAGLAGADITAYRVFRNGQQIGTTAAGTTVYADTNLTPGTEYKYQIEAHDDMDNTSDRTAELPVTTETLDDFINHLRNVSAPAINAAAGVKTFDVVTGPPHTYTMEFYKNDGNIGIDAISAELEKYTAAVPTGEYANFRVTSFVANPVTTVQPDLRLQLQPHVAGPGHIRTTNAQWYWDHPYWDDTTNGDNTRGLTGAAIRAAQHFYVEFAAPPAAGTLRFTIGNADSWTGHSPGVTLQSNGTQRVFVFDIASYVSGVNTADTSNGFRIFLHYPSGSGDSLTQALLLNNMDFVNDAAPYFIRNANGTIDRTALMQAVTKAEAREVIMNLTVAMGNRTEVIPFKTTVKESGNDCGDCGNDPCTCEEPPCECDECGCDECLPPLGMCNDCGCVKCYPPLGKCGICEPCEEDAGKTAGEIKDIIEGLDLANGDPMLSI
jgi:chitodextrinase